MNVQMRLFLLIAGFLLLAGCGATAPPDAQTMLQNLAKSYPALWKFTTATAYILGWTMIFKALYSLKMYGEQRSMMSSQSSIKGPLLNVLVGAMLIYFPTAFQIVNYTFFASSNILQYSGSGVSGWTTASTVAVIGLIQFIGLLAFIRGWLYIARAGEQGGQPGTMGKGFTHIVGGVLAINIVQTKDIIWNTFGFGS